MYLLFPSLCCNRCDTDTNPKHPKNDNYKNFVRVAKVYPIMLKKYTKNPDSRQRRVQETHPIYKYTGTSNRIAYVYSCTRVLEYYIIYSYSCIDVTDESSYVLVQQQ
jgi:hypothetical protein